MGLRIMILQLSVSWLLGRAFIGLYGFSGFHEGGNLRVLVLQMDATSWLGFYGTSNHGSD